MNGNVSIRIALALAGAAGLFLAPSGPQAQAAPVPPSAAAPPEPAPVSQQAMQAQIERMQAQIEALQAGVKRLKAAQAASGLGALKISPPFTPEAPKTFSVPPLGANSPLTPGQPYHIYVQPSPLRPDPRLNVVPPPQRYTNIPPSRIIPLQQEVPDGDVSHAAR